MESAILSGKLFGWYVLTMDCSAVPTHAHAQLDTIFYAASLNVTRYNFPVVKQANFSQEVRLYLHQGGPLALQSQVQLNQGGKSTVIRNPAFSIIYF